ncbi:MAG: rRNA maturation RNase YbeY [Chloroflexota bacterium]
MIESGADNSIEISFTLSCPESPADLARIEQMLSWAAKREGIAGELGIWLCTDDEIADLHLRYMDIDGATDVITFPEDAPDAGGYLGDIAVSVDTATAQSEDAGHGAAREVAYLCLHGMLHIAGYDDLDNEARARMLARQEDLLNEFERDHPGSWG